MEKIVVALGGNALLAAKGKQFISKELANVRRAMEEISKVANRKGMRVVITHGNGPQVGDELVKNEISEKLVPKLPLYLLNAETQASIGSMLELALRNALLKKGIKKEIFTIITHVIVNKNDKAFRNPSKPVGPFYSKDELEKILKREKFDYVKERNGYRRVVASPLPKNIVEISAIKQALEDGKIVIAGGGGGIPVYKSGKYYYGIDAVIDKDLTSMILANAIDAKKLIILTDVDYVYWDYKHMKGKIKSMKANKIRSKISLFEEGTIKPKIQACIGFVNKNKNKKEREAYIGNLFKLEEIIKGTSGSKFY